MLKKHNFKTFRCNPNDANFDINKITEDFEKIVALAKSKELKRYAKNILPYYKK